MAKNNLSKIMNFIAFVGLIMVAIVLVLQKIFQGGELIGAMRTIGESIAYAVTAVASFFYVRSKRNVWWYVAYFVAVVLVIVFMVIR